MSVERASVFEGIQLGVEDTAAPGVVVSANRRLYSFDLDLDPNIPSEDVRPQGHLFSSDEVYGKEWTDGSVKKGHLAFNDVVYQLASILCAPVITALGGAAHRWVFTPINNGPNVLQTYTVEKGSAAGAERCSGVYFDELEVKFSKQAPTLSAKVMGGQLADGITLTPTPTDIAIVSVSAPDSSVYVGADAGSLVQLNRCLEMSWKITNRQSPVFTQDASEPSYSATVENAVQLLAHLEVEQNSDAAAFMTALRARTRKFLRIVSTGADIVTGIPYRIQLTMPFKFKSPKRGDKDSVYAGMYDLKAEWSPDAGYGVEVIVDNTLSAL